MSFISFFKGEKKSSASVAKERLSIILARESVPGGSNPDFIPKLQQELMAVISRYVNINPEDLRINIERQDNLEVLEVKIELPEKGINS